MPDTALHREKREEIETHLAQEIDGRDLIIDLEVFIHGQFRRGYIDEARKNELLDITSVVRLAVMRGLDYTRRVRGSTEDYYT